MLFGAFTGQRSQATVARLKVGQFRAAIANNKPVIEVLPEQDKIRMQHYCPLAPHVVAAITPLLDGRADDKVMFKQLSFERWLRQQNVLLTHVNKLFLPGDLKKACQQIGEQLLWDQSNKNYILTHGVSGVDWRFYRSPRPDSVYDTYMQDWGDVTFKERSLSRLRGYHDKRHPSAYCS
ncbi:MAG: hypothetical protein ACXVIG_07615 [Halobacteriota archaeon]